MERELLESSITKARIIISQMEKDLEALASRADDLKKAVTHSEERRAAIENVLTSVRAAIKEQTAKAVDEALSGAKRERIEELRARLAELEGYKAECKTKIEELEERRNQKGREISELNEKKIREESVAERLETERNSLAQKVEEEYGLDYASAIQMRIDEYDYQKSLTLINKIKRKISELGNVNMLAIDEYGETGKRYDDMTVQRDDMKKAENDLVKIINDLTGDMHAKFKTEFEKINDNFMDIFKQLFNGGKAKLTLEDAGDKDILNAGIEIYAEPPGKKLQHISLLSGGEKALTAIAILFAILKLKPMPFCVLDEIEAALDDANANLFAEYLRKFSKNTQFIVITHRKPTMELADTLYGVTMEEKGVSKLVSVQLGEAVKLHAAESK
jgi:chromosome segregation protein